MDPTDKTDYFEGNVQCHIRNEPTQGQGKLLTKWELDKLIVSTFSVLFSGLLPDLALLSDHSIQVHSK